MPRSDEAGSRSPRRLRNLSACEHARYLLAPSAAVKRLGAGFDGDSFAIAARCLVKPVMGIGMGRDLRRVRHGQDLRPMPQPGKTSPNRRSSRPANTRVDLIEDKNRGGGLFRENNFESEKKTGQFSARSDLHQWAGVRPRVRLNMKHHRFTPERSASEATLILGKYLSLGHEPRFFKPQRSQLFLNRSVQKSGRGTSLFAQHLARPRIGSGSRTRRLSRG